MAEEKNPDLRKGDMVTIKRDPSGEVSPDYRDRLGKTGRIDYVDNSISEDEPSYGVRWPDIPNSIRVYPWWQLERAKE